MGKQRKSGGRRRRRALAARLVLVAGIVGSLIGLFLPWAEIDPEAYGWFKGALADLGWLPEAGRPVRGYEIPWRVREESSRLGVATALVLDDIGAGRLDRAAARALFGERVEVHWAPLVLIPAGLGLLHGLLLLWGPRRRTRPPRILWAWLGLLDVLTTCALVGITYRALDDSGGAPLRVLAGLWITVLSTSVLSLGALGTARAR